MFKKIEFLDLKKITNLHHQEYIQVIDDVLKDYLKLKINDIPNKTKILKNKE